ERLAKELLEDLRAGARDDVLGLGRHIELAAHERRGGFPELGYSGRRAVMRLVLLDRTNAEGLRARRAVERAVADLELDDILASSLQRLGDAEHGERRLDRQRSSELAELYRHVVLLRISYRGRPRRGSTLRCRAARRARPASCRAARPMRSTIR